MNASISKTWIFLRDRAHSGYQDFGILFHRPIANRFSVNLYSSACAPLAKRELFLQKLYKLAPLSGA